MEGKNYYLNSWKQSNQHKEMNQDDRDVESVTRALCAATISDNKSEVDGGDYRRLQQEEGAVGGEIPVKSHKSQLTNGLLGGENLSRGSSSVVQGVNLYVKNLDQSFGDEQLRKEFSPYGIITSAKVMTDELGQSKGFGFVSFTNPLEASRAVAELNGRLILAKPLYVGLAQCREDRKIHLATQFMHRMKFHTNTYTDHKRAVRGRGAVLSNGHVPRGRGASVNGRQAESEPRWEVPRPRAPLATRFHRPSRHPLFSQASRNYHLGPRFGEPPVGLRLQDPRRREPDCE